MPLINLYSAETRAEFTEEVPDSWEVISFDQPISDRQFDTVRRAIERHENNVGELLEEFDLSIGVRVRQLINAIMGASNAKAEETMSKLDPTPAMEAKLELMVDACLENGMTTDSPALTRAVKVLRKIDKTDAEGNRKVSRLDVRNAIERLTLIMDRKQIPVPVVFDSQRPNNQANAAMENGPQLTTSEAEEAESDY